MNTYDPKRSLFGLRFFFRLTLTLTICIGFIFSAARPVIAQTNAGRLIGTVSGPDGVLQGATVVAKDNATGKERTVTTGDDGGFSIFQLEFGVYTVIVSTKGFKTFTASDLKIDAGREYSLIPVLEIGDISENVTILAGTDILNATNGELGTTVSPQQIKALPLNGRNPLALVGLQAGVAGRSGAINGTRTSSVNYTRDGINVQDNFIRNGFVTDAPNIDDTSEFTIITQNAGAESGYGTAQVQLVTPRGGSEFHGSLYEYNRNSNFAANDFFDNRDGIEREILNRNQFGGAFSGPLPLPKFGEGGASTVSHKAFFFGSYEGFRLANGVTKTTTILTPGARSGDFTYRRADNGQLQTVNVLTGAGLAGAIPANAGGSLAGVDPTIQSRILDSVPAVGNTADVGDQLNTTGFAFNQSNPEKRASYTTRIDMDINSNNSIYGVYRYNSITDARTDIDSSFNVDPVSSQGGPTKFFTLAWRINPTANFSNEVRGGGQFSDALFTNDDLPQESFLIGPDPATVGPSLPLITSPEVNFRDQGRNSRILNFQDNASLVKGDHAIQFGSDVQLYKVLSFDQANLGLPTYNITNINNPATPRLPVNLFPGGISAGDRNNADALRYLLGGIVGSGSVRASVASVDDPVLDTNKALDRNLKYETIAFYGGDQWRITPQLTLNYGLRYELYTPLRSTDGLYLEPVIQDGATATQALLDPNGTLDFVGGNSGKEGQFFKLDKNNFAPNISIAYAPRTTKRLLKNLFGADGKTVIRAGFRVGYVNDEYVRSSDAFDGTNAGLAFAANVLNPANGSVQLNSRLDSLPPPTIPAFIDPPRTYLQNNAIAGNFATIGMVDPNLQIQRTVEYNFGIQRDLGLNTALEIRYVGQRSNQLVRSLELNQIDVINNGFATGVESVRLGQQTAAQAFPTLTANAQTIITQQATLGTPADIALAIITGAPGATLSNRAFFLPNPSLGAALLLTNGGKYRYDSLQAEVRRRFNNGLSFQANYTYQKILTNVTGSINNQTRNDPPLNFANIDAEYSRAPYDNTHTFNFNGIYELPFGRNKRFFSQSGVLDQIIGGWQVSSIFRIVSGLPLSILDAGSGSTTRGTLNRNALSVNQTAFTTLTKDQIKSLTGVRETPDGIFFIDPSVIDLNAAGTSGRAANGFGSTPFDGQVFFNNDPGTTSGLERLFIDGPRTILWDAALSKRFRISERVSLQVRADAFNVTNSVNFASPNLNINSTQFGRITGTVGLSTPRIIQFSGRLEF